MKERKYVAISQIKCNKLVKETRIIAKKFLDGYGIDCLACALKRITRIENLSKEDETKVWNKLYEIIGK